MNPSGTRRGDRGAGRIVRAIRAATAPRPTPGAFTLVELLVVAVVIGILAALLFPVLVRSRLSAQRVQCAGNLHQLGIAAQLYWNDNGGDCFTTRTIPTNGGMIHWCGWLGGGAEGERAYDFSSGKLFPYLDRSDVRLCPALNAAMAQFKLKATNGIFFSYGYNELLSAPARPVKVSSLRRATETVLFADAAQVNDFQAPASPANPLLEEWYYLDNPTNYPGRNYYPHGHFRHGRMANAVFCDGHVGREPFVAGSIDPKLPAQWVGRLRPEILLVP